MQRFVIAVLAVAGLAAACSGSESSAPASSSSPPSTTAPASSAGSTPEQAAMQGLQQMLQQGGQGAKAVEYTALQAVFPDIPGWEKGDSDGEQGEMMGISFARAEASYNKGDANVKLEIIDTALIQAMVMPFSMMARGGYHEKSDEGYKRGTTINGHPGWEEWENQTQSGDVNVLVANRFIVHASGHDLPNLDPIRAVVTAVPAARLSALVK